MGKKYFDTKAETLESSILGVWQEAAKKTETEEELSAKQKKIDLNKNGKVDGDDLQKLRKKGNKKEEVKEGELPPALKKAIAKKKGNESEDEDDLDEGKVIFDDHDDEDEDFIALTKKLGLKFKTKGDETTVSGNDANISKMLKTMKMKKDTDGHAILEGFAVPEDVPAMEVGTDRYREYAVGLTPGENAEFAAAKDFKVASMKEALAKVWGLDEKTLDKTSKEDYDEEDEELKPVKGSKTMTGGKVAKVDTKPKLD